MEINADEFMVKTQETLEELGMDRGEASCYAEKFAKELKVKTVKELPAEVFSRIFYQPRREI